MIADIVETGLGAWWAPALAFVAGTVSFASPCVFPLVPGYISFVSGERVVDEGSRRSLLPILLFIAGFTVVFTLAGVFSPTLVPIFKGEVGQRVAGAVVIVLGSLMLGYALGLGPFALYAERRPFLQRTRPGVWGAMPLGMAFAAGWTPCIGPVLGGVLGLAAASESALRGGFLLMCYSLGLGLPFLIVGLGIQHFIGAFAWVKRNYRWIAGASGTLLIAVGVLLVTGWFTRLFAPLARFAPGL